MSSIVNKIKDAVAPSHSTSDPEGTHGPHGSRAANTVDPLVDSDNDRRHGVGSTTGHTTTGHTAGSGLTSGNHNLTGGPAPNTAGPHGSDMANRLDPRVDSDRDNSTTLGGNPRTGHNVPEGTHGPHGSRVANTLDPRVDSDRDRTTGLGSGSTASTGGAFGSATGAGAGTHFTSGTHGTAEGVHGPHSTRAGNALDPRVDSDLDGSHNTTGTAFGASGTHGATGTHGIGGTTGTHGTAEGTHGPHGSRVANTLDPRVDSDHDGSRTAGNTTGTGYGTSGTHTTHGTAEGMHGPHGSRAANALDPRVDSDRDGRAQHTGGHATSTGDRIAGHAGSAVGGVHGTGPAPNTAGPHKSDLLNKLDPRVDSNLDGSKTVGGDKTYAQSYSHQDDRHRFDDRDPSDASQVPPSVMKRHIGEPEITHGDHGHDREVRNSKTTHQERFSGV